MAGGELGDNPKPIALWEIDLDHPEQIERLGVDGNTLDHTLCDFAFDAIAFRYPETFSEDSLDSMTAEDRLYFASLINVVAELVGQDQNGEVHLPSASLIADIEEAASVSPMDETAFLQMLHYRLRLALAGAIGAKAPDDVTPPYEKDPVLFPGRQIRSLGKQNPEEAMRAWLAKALALDNEWLQVKISELVEANKELEALEATEEYWASRKTKARVDKIRTK